MKVLVLADLSSPHSWRWIRSLKERGAQVKCVSFEEPKEKEEDAIVLHTGIKSKRLKYLLNAHRIKGIVDEYKPDLLNPHFIPNYGLLSRIAGRGKPYFLCAWGSDLLVTPKKGLIQRKITKWVLRGASSVYVDSEMLKRIVISFGVEENKILLFPFGVGRDWLREKPEPFQRPKTWKFFSHRRLDPDMDPFTLIHGFKRALNKGLKGTLSIASSGTLEESLRVEVKRLGIEQINFLGWQREERLRELLKESHFYLSSSLTDSTSVSLLEAMSMGAFPIVSDIEGNREWIHHEKNGLLFKVGDPEDLADKILFAVKNLELVKKARDFNRRLVEEKADWESNFNIAFDVMKEIATNNIDIPIG